MRVRAVQIAAAMAAALALVFIGVVGAGAQGSKKQSKALFAVLTGKKEVSAEGDKGVGDPDGRGSFTAIFDGNEMCYGLTNKNIQDPVAAHIHKGGPNVAGPVVVPLQQPATGDPGASSDCVEVDPALARAIHKNPHKYYVNVHTADFPGGAVRGQLFGKRR
ncbi:MAG: CHRD domain-containing protein [Thermoleophilaceae bacterium]